MFKFKGFEYIFSIGGLGKAPGSFPEAYQKPGSAQNPPGRVPGASQKSPRSFTETSQQASRSLLEALRTVPRSPKQL
jgi:hypothetical protein